MATQTLEFNATGSQTFVCKLFAVGSDTVVATANATEKTNDVNRYLVDFTDIPVGAYRLNAFVGAVGGFVNELYDLTLTTATFYPRSESGTDNTAIASAVRIELTTELDEIGSVKSKTDQLTFTDNSVNATLTNDSIQDILDSIPINISVGIASNDSTIKTTKLQVNQGETINQSIAVFLSDLSTPVDLSEKTLEILFENKNEEFVALIENANITLSGENSNVVTFSYPIEVTRTLENKIWSLRDTDETKKVYSKGVLDILRAANKRG